MSGYCLQFQFFQRFQQILRGKAREHARHHTGGGKDGGVGEDAGGLDNQHAGQKLARVVGDAREGRDDPELTVRKESNGEERIGNIGSYGPDLDKNYGFDGCVYLTALLYYKYGPKDNQEARLKALDEHKRALARMFGLGKSSKAKPGPLLEHSRDLYDKLTAELKAANALNEDDDE